MRPNRPRRPLLASATAAAGFAASQLAAPPAWAADPVPPAPAPSTSTAAAADDLPGLRLAGGGHVPLLERLRGGRHGEGHGHGAEHGGGHGDLHTGYGYCPPAAHTPHGYFIPADLRPAAVFPDGGYAPGSTGEGGHRYMGTNSCAAMACHGNDVPSEGLIGLSQKIWEEDPHAKAWSVLFEARSVAMWEAYRGRIADAVDDGDEQLAAGVDFTATHPSKARECIVCHGAPPATGAPAGGPTRTTPWGVGCEGCHGPAGDWISVHVRPEWDDPAVWPAERKAAAGYVVLEDLATRALACAECHVGAPDREVNHDLIAAGHPRLSYEFSAYQAIEPAHWSRSQDRREYGAFDARAWAVGQVVTAAQALTLLSHRAGQEDTAPWPEFSEYNCYSCHQAIAEPGWQTGRPADGFRWAAPAGRSEWGTWWYPLVEVLAEVRPDAPADLNDRIEDLRTAMQKVRPDREAVGTAADALAADLFAWGRAIQRAPLGSDEIRRIVEQLRERREELVSSGWEPAAQAFLAAAALRLGYADTVRPGWNGGGYVSPRPSGRAFEALRRTRRLLAFPDGRESPAFRPAARTAIVTESLDDAARATLGLPDVIAPEPDAEEPVDEEPAAEEESPDDEDAAGDGPALPTPGA